MDNTALVEPADQQLQTEALAILKNEVVQETPIGSPLQTAVADRWNTILKAGLAEDKRKDLLSKYPLTNKFFNAAANTDVVSRRDMDINISNWC